MIEKKISVLQYIRAQAIFSTYGDLIKGGDEDASLAFVATYLADDAALKASRKNPEALKPFIEQAETMEPEEFAEVMGFFMAKYVDYQASIVQKIGLTSKQNLLLNQE